MRIFALHRGSVHGEIVAYVAGPTTAFEAVCLTHSSVDGWEVTMSGIDVRASSPKVGYVRYVLEPIDVMIEPHAVSTV